MKTSEIQQQLTDAVIAQLKNDIVPWRKPWTNDPNCKGVSTNVVSNKEYRGINIIMLYLASRINGMPSKFWATYKQWQEKGCQVKKGQKGSTIVFWNFFDKTSEDPQGNFRTSKIPFLKTFSVFNAEQVDGDFAKQFMPNKESGLSSEQVDFKKAIEIIGKTKAVVEHGGNVACFSSSNKKITMPSFTSFQVPEEYYATLFHELAHWADDKLGNDKKEYEFNELVAEMSSVILCGHAEINYNLQNHVSYLSSWIKKLESDCKYLMAAAKKATSVVDLIVGKEAIEEVSESIAA